MKWQSVCSLGATVGALLIVSPRGADAHFLWAQVTPGTEPSFRLTFAENAGEDTTESLIGRIKPTRVWTADGKPLTLKPEKGALATRLPAGARVAAVEQTWGVMDRQAEGRGKFLLRYYAKAASDTAGAAESAKLLVEVFLKREGTLCIATVRQEGKPVAGAEVTLVRPGETESVAIKANAVGEVRFTAEQAGTCQIRAMVPEQQSGTQDGKAYDLVRSYSTLTVPVGAETRTARGLLEASHGMRETWGSNFPGFTANLRLHQGERTAEGSVTVSSKGEVTLKVLPADLQSTVEGTLRMIVGHRMAGAGSDFTQATLAPADRHPQGTSVLLNDGIKSFYRVRDGQIMQVNRTMGGSAFTIDILENTVVDGGRYLPHTYTVSYRDEKTGALQRVQSFQESYARVGDFWLPSERRVVTAANGDTTVSVLQLSDHQLTSPVSSRAAR